MGSLETRLLIGCSEKYVQLGSNFKCENAIWFFHSKVKGFFLLVEMKTKALQKNILGNLQVNCLIKSWLAMFCMNYNYYYLVLKVFI
jgi:hypothetical protein